MADLTTLANVKGYLGLGENTAQDAVLARLIAAESDWFRRQIGRYIESGEHTETVIHDGTDCIIPRQTPVTAVAELVADGVTVPESSSREVAGWYLVDGMIWLRGWYVPDRSVVDLTYTAGYSPIPADIEQAVIEMVALRFQERHHVGTANLNQAGISVTFLPAIVPQSVRDVIEGYRRVSV